MNMKRGPFMVSPRSFVQQSLGELLGGNITSFGHFKHKVMDSAGFKFKSEQEVFEIFDKLWENANIKKQ